MVQPIGAEALVALLEGGLDRVVLIDSRSFVDFNSSHILDAVNVNGSKLMKRRLQQDKVQIGELLQLSARSKLELQAALEVVVYDQTTSDPAALGCDCFLSVLLAKLQRSFSCVHLLSGGFAEFSRLFPGLCEGKLAPVPVGMSQPGLPPPPVSGPTCILPHLYLGCQRDVLNQDVMRQNAIVFVLNASHTCPKPDFIPESNFLRVPVNDSFCEKILPWLDRSLEFIEKAKTSNGRVLVHCLAGISRSATIAIAYIMKRMDLSLDEAYRFVKEKRPTISPNFNFLGQLLDFEKKIRTPHAGQTKVKAPPSSQDMGVGAEHEDPAELQLVQTLRSLQLADVLEDSARLKRSFSLDIKSYGEPGGHRPPPPQAGSADASDSFKEPTSQRSQFSPVAEVSEQSTLERGPDTEATVAAPSPPLSVEERARGFLLGLSRSQQRLSTVGGGLKGWSSDLLLGGWYLSTSTVLGGGGGGGSSFAAYSCIHGLKAVRRRGRQRAGDQGDSRRSWHEESTFEKQLKRRSCHMELGEGRTDGRSRDELRTLAAQDAFSGSMEVIQVS